ncbi:MAG: hypothetical protein R3C49_02920 [Planctomycetaceae bacterium]
MKVAVLYNQPLDDTDQSDLDVLVQRDAVSESLQRLGHDVVHLSCTLNLETARRQLIAHQPDAVFNLVESLAGTDRLMAAATLLLEAMRLPFTGANSVSLLETSAKPVAKQRLVDAGLPTPAWRIPESGAHICPRSDSEIRPDCWILKPVWEHASVGMTDDAVITANSEEELQQRLRDWQQTTGRPCFAEEFIAGREFNLSVLDGQALPPAEIDFSAFPQHKPRIVGQDAKWNSDSFEYHQTPRTFTFATDDSDLLKQLQLNALRCAELFNMSAYCRVDFRVDQQGRPWILEINANPCLSPDAGFAAAVAQSGFTFDSAIDRVLQHATAENILNADRSLKPR